MPADPRRRNAATALAVVLAVLLALVWLRSSGDAPPQVPAGLGVPAPSAEPAARTELGQGGEAGDSAAAGRGAATGDAAWKRVGRRPARPGRSRRRARKPSDGHADRAGGGEDVRAPVGDRGARARSGTAGEAGGQDLPATAPGPKPGSSGAPEFALG